jgi:ABC transporter family protein
MMRHSFMITFSISFIFLAVFIGTLNVLALPSDGLYALQQSPDLSGKNIYFSEDFSEASQFDRTDRGISHYASLLRLMGANLFVLDWRQSIPEDVDLVIIPAPTKDYTSEAIARLWIYIQKGGHVLLLVDPLDDKGNISQALKAGKGLFGVLWSDFGLRARDDVVVVEGNLPDKNGTVTGESNVQAPGLSLGFQTSLTNDQHPITQGLTGASGSASDTPPPPLFTFFGARSLEIDASFQNVVVTPLILVNQPNIYGEVDYANYLTTGSAAEYNIGVDTPKGALILAAAVEHQSLGTRMVLISDGDFIKNGGGFVTSPDYSGGFVYPAQANFMIRASAWLLGVEGSSLAFPTPAATGTATITPSPMPEVSPTAEATAAQ